MYNLNLDLRLQLLDYYYNYYPLLWFKLLNITTNFNNVILYVLRKHRYIFTIIEHGNYNRAINSKYDYNQYCLVVASNQFNLLKYLVEYQKFDVNFNDAEGLIMATQNNHFNIVRYLINNCVDIDEDHYINEYGPLVKSIFKAIINDNIKIFKYLLNFITEVEYIASKTISIALKHQANKILKILKI